jgi:DNA-binding NarL/FixJ family response regulator
MSTICLYTQNSRLSQKWESLLSDYHQIKLFKSFDTLKKALGDNTYVVLHDDSTSDAVIKELDILHDLYEKKNTLVLRTVPKLEEGEAFLSHDIGGYGNANMSDDAFVQAVEVVRGGNVWLYPELMEHLIGKINHLNQKSDVSEALSVLTPREKEVASLVAQGESNKLIASHLKISQNTVKLHIASIFEKLHVDSRVALALRVSGSR